MIVFIIVLIIVVWFVQQWSLKNAFKGLDYNCVCSKILVEPDEELELITTVTNSSARFVPFIRLEESLPGKTNVLHKSAKIKTDARGNLQHISTIYMWRKSCLQRRLPVSLPERGRYYFKGADLISGDFLGLAEDRRTFYSINEVVVYPKAAPLADISGMLGGFLGDISVRRFIMEDPVLTIGAREYTGNEPLKQISWKQSARTGRLMVKQFDYTVEPTVSILLDVNTWQIGDKKSQLLENCFSLTRSVCQLLENKGIPYDFITNATTGNVYFNWSYLPEGLGRGHFHAVLEGLGQASYNATEAFATTITKLHNKRETSRSTIIIMPERAAAKHHLAEKLQEQDSLLIFIYGEDR